MKEKRITANFFWNSSELSLYEYACLKSFEKNEFNVEVYSYNKINLPQGIKLRDAKSIIDGKEIKKFIHNGKKGCLAAFADKFRIELQKKKLGWWFDIDIVCLKKSIYFSKLEKNKKIVVGLETSNKINNAVLKINDINLCEIILKRISKIGYKFKWGAIGPRLIKTILIEKNLLKDSIKKEFFYAINYQNFQILLLPKYLEYAKKITNNSFVCHNYNHILNRFGIPKNILPPKNSFLYEQFIKYCPELKNREALPLNTAMRLLEKRNSFTENIKDLIPSLVRAFN
jgi:hypothetical protein